MRPRPSSTCVALTIGLVALLLVGIGFANAAVTSLAAAGVVFIGAAYAATYPLARRARLERLEFAWWLAPREAPVDSVLVAGAPIDVRCFIRHRARHRIRVSGLAPVLPAGLRLSEGLEGSLEVPPGARADFAGKLVAASVGRHVAQGLAARIEGPLALFTMPLYFPYPLSLKVLPRTARALRGAPRRPPEAHGARSGRVRLERRGGGSELRELRELVPGDPFKSIAWKASARYGKLVVREVEHESRAAHFVALDVGPSMRGGPLGARKLDRALEWVASNVDAWLKDGDRVAAATFDGRLVGRLTPGEGRAQMLRALDLLVTTTELVDGDLTDVEDAAVAVHVARYLRHQMGLDFRALPHAGEALESLELIRHVASMVGDDRRTVEAESEAGRAQRRFCQLRGLDLPYRAHTSAVERATALGEALALVHRPGAPSTEITVVTDAEDLPLGDELFRRIGGLRAHGHIIRFVVLRTGEVAEASESSLGRHLAAVHRSAEARRLEAVRAKLIRWGVFVELVPLDVGPGDARREVEEAA
jgi:uncharacterized protein (DUF58 family)